MSKHSHSRFGECDQCRRKRQNVTLLTIKPKYAFYLTLWLCPACQRDLKPSLERAAGIR